MKIKHEVRCQCARCRGVHVRREHNPDECQWFLLCTNDATMTRKHPVLGSVPICETCNSKIERLTENA